MSAKRDKWRDETNRLEAVRKEADEAVGKAKARLRKAVEACNKLREAWLRGDEDLPPIQGELFGDDDQVEAVEVAIVDGPPPATGLVEADDWRSVPIARVVRDHHAYEEIRIVRLTETVGELASGIQQCGSVRGALAAFLADGQIDEIVAELRAVPGFPVELLASWTPAEASPAWHPVADRKELLGYVRARNDVAARQVARDHWPKVDAFDLSVGSAVAASMLPAGRPLWDWQVYTVKPGETPLRMCSVFTEREDDLAGALAAIPKGWADVEAIKLDQPRKLAKPEPEPEAKAAKARKPVGAAKLPTATVEAPDEAERVGCSPKAPNVVECGLSGREQDEALDDAVYPDFVDTDWRDLQIHGASDEEVLAELVKIWPAERMYHERTGAPRYTVQGGESPRFWFGSSLDNGKPRPADLSGPALVAAVRRVRSLQTPEQIDARFAAPPKPKAPKSKRPGPSPSASATA